LCVPVLFVTLWEYATAESIGTSLSDMLARYGGTFFNAFEAFGVVFGPVLPVLAVVVFAGMLSRKKLTFRTAPLVLLIVVLGCFASLQACAVFSRIGKSIRVA